MALIFPEDIIYDESLSPKDKTLLSILEQQLTDEWDFYTYLEEGRVANFFVLNPEFGLFLIVVCQTFSDDLSNWKIVSLKDSEKAIETIITLLSNEYSLVNSKGNLKFSVNFGVLFMNQADKIIIKNINREKFFDEFLSTSIEDGFIALSEGSDFEELSIDDLNTITGLLPELHNVLSSQINCFALNVKPAVNEIQPLIQTWWNELDAIWQDILLKAVGASSNIITNDTLESILAIIKLDVSGTYISDIQPIKRLKHLKILGINDTAVQDLSPLGFNSALRILSINGTQVDDISPVSVLNDLQYFSMCRTMISDLRPLCKLENLQFLSIIDSKVTNLNPLMHIRNLKHLTVTGCKISDLAPMRTMSNLIGLVFDHTDVVDLEPISNLTALKILGFEHTGVKSLSPLKGLINIETLFFGNTLVEDLSPVAELENLKEVYLDHSKVNDLTPLSGLSNLEKIEAQHLDINDMSSFRKKYPKIETQYQTHNENKTLTIGGHYMKNESEINPFINHLEFLGYEVECLLKEGPNDNSETFLCRHPVYNDFFFLIAHDIDFIFFQSLPIFLDSLGIELTREKIFELINSLNINKLIVCTFIGQNGNEVSVRMSLMAQYDKVFFGRAIKLFEIAYSSIYQQLSKISNQN